MNVEYIEIFEYKKVFNIYTLIIFMNTNQQIIKTLDSGEFLVSIKAGHYNQVLPIVRYWLPHIKIVSPDGLRDRLMEELRGYLSGKN